MQTYRTRYHDVVQLVYRMEDTSMENCSSLLAAKDDVYSTCTYQKQRNVLGTQTKESFSSTTRY